MLWNNLEFGTSLVEFRKAYPSAEAVGESNEGGPFPFVSYRLRGQSFGNLRTCDLEFSFAGPKRELYRLQAQCGAQGEDVYRLLTARYGNPTHVSQGTIVWHTRGVEVTFAPTSGVFTIADRERSKGVAAALMRMLGRVPIGPTQPPASGDITPEPSLSDRPQ